MRTATQSSHSYDFRRDFDSIARPGMHRYLDISADLLGGEFDAGRRAGYAKGYVRDLWRMLKSVQNDFGEFGITPDWNPEIKTWTHESALALAEECAADAVDAEKREA